MASHFSDVMWVMEQVMWKRQDQRVAAFLLEEAADRLSKEIVVGPVSGQSRSAEKSHLSAYFFPCSVK